MPKFISLKLVLMLVVTVLAGLTLGSGVSTALTAKARPLAPLISPEQAISLALNNWTDTGAGYEVRQPRHTATFTPDGVTVTPRRGGDRHRWQLGGVLAGTTPLTGVELGPIEPQREGLTTVSYPRGGLVEQYVAQTDGLTQQFLLPQPLPLRGNDLAITGTLSSTAAFKTGLARRPWLREGEIEAWDRVRAFDAHGLDIPAALTITDESMQLEIDGPALESASYPVTIAAELGDTFRISDMGPDGDTSFFAFEPAVTYNNATNEYLVVWQGDDNTGDLVPGAFEIFGQRLDGMTGTEVGVNDFRISDMGVNDRDPNFFAFHLAVVYNSMSNEYLVVWDGDDTVNDAFEIYGQRLNATGEQIGVNDFRITDMGLDDEDTNFDAFFPAVTYNTAANEYLVVWTGIDDTGPFEEIEIFGQLLNASGEQIRANDFRISDMGPDGDLNFEAIAPAVAYNSSTNEYLVVWWGDDNTAPLGNNEYEIFGQRLDGTTGAEEGVNDFRISDMGPDGNTDFQAEYPTVVYNSDANEYLVVWHGENNTNGEYEIYGQLLDGTTMAEVGINDFRISDMGPDGNPNFQAAYPVVVYNNAVKEYLVVWLGNDTVDTEEENCGECEIYGQRLTVTGVQTGTNDFRISHMGPDGNTNFDAFFPAVAYNSDANEYLVVWDGDDDTGSLVEGENEIFGQLLPASFGLVLDQKVFLPLLIKGN